MKKAVVCLLGVVCMLLPTAVQAQSRAEEVVAALSAQMRALEGYEIGFEVAMGEYRGTGSYFVSGDNYYLVMGDNEVFADGSTRFEISNSQPQPARQSGPGVRFSGQRICTLAVVGARRRDGRAADTRGRERCSDRQYYAYRHNGIPSSAVHRLRLRRRAGYGADSSVRAVRRAAPHFRPRRLSRLRVDRLPVSKTDYEC